MIKRLLMSVREYKKDSLLSPFYVSLEVIMETLIPLLMAALIDSGIEASDLKFVIKMGVALLACATLSLFFGAMAGTHAAYASCGFAKNLRKDMYYNVQKFSFSNIDKFSTASIVTRLTTDVTNVQNAYQMIIRMAVRSPMMLLFAMIMSFGISPKLSLTFFAFIPVLGLGLFLIARSAHPIFKRVFRTYDSLNRVVQENVRGIRVVKSFVREEHEEEKFNKISEDIYKDFSKAEKLIAFNMPLMQISVYGCMLVISWFGAKLIVASGNDSAKGLTTGQLVSLTTYVIQILISLMMLSIVFIISIISRASAERIVEILEEKSDIVSAENAEKEVKDGSIVFENVSFRYSGGEEKNVLKNINLSIRSGQTVGILGGTGSSKSTLVSLIPRLYDVSGGRVLVGGTDVRNIDLKVLRDSVAMVLQKNVLFSGTIAQNLRWGNENVSYEQLKDACRLAHADGFIEKFPEKYDYMLEQEGANVSGGQKQRLCIARALLKKPKILILDDSTSAVDTKTDAEIRKAFANDIPDTTKLIIAQRVASVQDADMIIVMDEGCISAVGTHEELLKNSSIYREVYESQINGGKEDKGNDGR